jgi:protein-tyrosine phosphatase
VEELKLEAHIAALFTPPTSYNGSERASAIDGRLFLGSACSAQDPLWLQENQITHILNVADEVGLNETVLQGSGIVYRWLSIADRTFHFALNFDLFPHPERISFHFDSTSTSTWLSADCEFDIRGQFDAAFEFILSAYQLGGRVLVHCAAGVSRSATIAIVRSHAHACSAMTRAHIVHPSLSRLLH